MNDELRDTFFLECFELLEVLESGLLDLSNGEAEDPDDTVAAVFRAVHSVKGGAGAFALDGLVRLAHKFETVLDGIREKQIAPTPDVLKVCLSSADALSDRVKAEQSGEAPDEERESKLIEELSALIGAEEVDEAEALGGFMPLSIDLPGEDDARTPSPMDTAEEASGFRINWTPNASFFARGGEVTRLLRALTDLGDLESLCDAEATPFLEDLNPEQPAFKFALTLMTGGEEADVREVFEFATDDGDVEIEEIKNQQPVAPQYVGDPAQATDVSPPDEGGAAEAKPSPKPLESFEPQASAGAVAGKPKANQSPSTPKQTIRVDLDRVEQLINLVGELVINQAMLAQRMDGLDMPHDQAIIDGLDEFRLLTRDIQESVMAIRAQPVKPLFQKMARIVREAATATGKEVRLATSGEWTEVDKTIVERLSDPLTHMIRNAVDHGLESADQRLANGKPSEGVVTLAAAHRSGRIVIEVGDDGGGINRKKVFDVAVSKGILPADAAPTDAEIDNLLFAPGFSTASQVSDLSGRGVGMDVVKKAIQALGGRTSIASKPGAGTTFSISLPLTLAVLDGIVVSIAEQTAVLPLSNIVETLRAEMLEVKQVGGGSRVVLVRGVSIPVVDIGVELGFREPLSSLDEKVFIIVENHEGDAHAMVVDQIIDQRQVVIKGL
ncbi:MAG: chemotaxis protein CheA, partial [Pseudomonadota bacterium]